MKLYVASTSPILFWSHPAWSVWIETAGKKIPTSLAEIYTRIIDQATTAAQLGVTDYPSAVRQTLKNLADSGIRTTAEYPTGYTRRLDTAVRQNVLWGLDEYNQNSAVIMGDQFGADGYEISYHSGARPTHEAMGGKQYSAGEDVVINGVRYQSISTVEDLLHDYGCRHMKQPILLGISEPVYSPGDLKRLKTYDKEEITFEGQQMTRYEASQMQRKTETAIRHGKDRAAIAKAAGDDEMRIDEQAKINMLTRKYKALSDAAGLPTKMERASLAGFRPVKVPNNYISIKDHQEYEKLQNVLGNNSPKTVAIFADIKHNKTTEYGYLRSYAKEMKAGYLSSETTFEHFKSVGAEIDSKLVGQTTQNGILIKDKGGHFIARIIGSKASDRRSVSVDDALDAIKNPNSPLPDIKKRISDGRRSQKFKGANAMVSINPDTGKLIQVNPRGRKKK